MQQIFRFVDSEFNNREGIGKFNKMMREHPDFRVICMNTEPQGVNSVLYAVVDMPDTEDKTNE